MGTGGSGKNQRHSKKGVWDPQHLIRSIDHHSWSYLIKGCLRVLPALSLRLPGHDYCELAMFGHFCLFYWCVFSAHLVDGCYLQVRRSHHPWRPDRPWSELLPVLCRFFKKCVGVLCVENMCYGCIKPIMNRMEQSEPIYQFNLPGRLHMTCSFQL